MSLNRTNILHTFDNIVTDHVLLRTDLLIWDSEVLYRLGIDAHLNSANRLIVEELVEELELADAL